MSEDTISRQVAIDAFYKYPNVNWTTLDVLAKIDALPSAQPEIIRCKNCKYNATSKKCLNPNSFFLVPADDDYCSRAERKINE